MPNWYKLHFLAIYIYSEINFKQKSGVFHGNSLLNLIYAFQLHWFILSWNPHKV